MPAALKSCCSCIPQRWITVIMCFLGLFNAYAMRVCISIAITEMVIPSNNTIEFIDDTCPNNDDNTTDYKQNTTLGHELYDWSEYTQGIILSSFYWGYIFTNLVGGQIVEKYGGRHTLGLGVLSTAVLTVLTPLSVKWGGSTSLIWLRILMGLGEGITFPAVSVLLAQWIPVDERSKASAITFSGASLGTIFGMTAAGAILQHSNMGWPAVFYFYGGVGIISFILNYGFCFSKPSENPYISEEEARYLKDKIKNVHTDLPPTPWRYILRSGPVWAVIVATIGNAWGFLTISSDMPKYMSSVLKFSVENNGYLTSIPYLCMWICSCITSGIADSMIASGKVSTSIMRKIGNTISSLGPGTFLVAASYAGCNKILVVILFTIGMTLMGCSTFGTLINPLDLGPNYAGSIMGIVNGLSTLSGIVSPYLVGVLTPNQTIREWRVVFIIVFAFFFISNFFFLICGSGNLQRWNDPAFLKKDKGSDKEPIKEEIKLLPIKKISA